MEKASVSLVRELRPGDGLGDGMDQLVALVHHAYLFWAGGQRVRSIDRAGLDLMLATDLPPDLHDDALAWYLQLPERRMWAQALEDSAHEPLDGDLRASFHRRRPAGARRPRRACRSRRLHRGGSDRGAHGRGSRAKGSAPFSSVLPGGEAAGLYSIAGTNELIELGWRSQALEHQPGTAAAAH